VFNVFVYIFSVFTTKIFYCVTSYVLDEGVCVRRASHEKSFWERHYVRGAWRYLLQGSLPAALHI